jgi:hypothetical protein
MKEQSWRGKESAGRGGHNLPAEQEGEKASVLDTRPRRSARAARANPSRRRQQPLPSRPPSGRRRRKMLPGEAQVADGGGAALALALRRPRERSGGGISGLLRLRRAVVTGGPATFGGASPAVRSPRRRRLVRSSDGGELCGLVPPAHPTWHGGVAACLPSSGGGAPR